MPACTPFGFRLGSAQGSFTVAPGDRRLLVPNPLEQGILGLIIESLARAEGATLGAKAYRVAHQLNADGLTHPRNGKQWHVGTLKSLHNTARRRNERCVEVLVRAALALDQGGEHEAGKTQAPPSVPLGAHPPGDRPPFGSMVGIDKGQRPAAAG